ncbi:hypothetical protein [Pseudomonas sp. NFACC45]|uniref:hypothetical protein n=1 Tax=Pseudomonas sp. NFACC45 TaxID=1566201 RepID=UPI0035276818
MLNAQYFGVPQQRRRIFLVAGYRRLPPFEFLADAAPVDAIPPASLDPMATPRGYLGCQYSIGKQSRIPVRFGLYHFRRSPERMGSDG